MFTANNSDAHWEVYGKRDPYFGVLSDEKFKSENMDEDARESFFSSGHRHVEHVRTVIQRRLVADFSPKTILDFGCGVGRLVIPLSAYAQEVVGLDVSNAMLAEARKNCREKGIVNVRFVKTIEDLSAAAFDFIHSVIVFQHIPTKKGEKIVASLIDRLAPGGVGALHFTYNAARYARLVHWTLRNVPFAWNCYNVLIGRAAQYPIMQTNYYDLNRIFFLLQSKHCDNLHIEFTRTKRNSGVMVYFQKNQNNEEFRT